VALFADFAVARHRRDARAKKACAATGRDRAAFADRLRQELRIVESRVTAFRREWEGRAGAVTIGNSTHHCRHVGMAATASPRAFRAAALSALMDGRSTCARTQLGGSVTSPAPPWPWGLSRPRAFNGAVVATMPPDRPAATHDRLDVRSLDSLIDDSLPAYTPVEASDFPDLISHSFRPSPPANFLDTILNPDDVSRFFPHAATPPDPYPSIYAPFDAMVPRTRARGLEASRPARLPNGYVDLTAPDSPPQRRKRESPAPGPSSKRQKRETAAAAKQESPEAVKVEEGDLTDDKQSVQDILQKQREDAVKAQPKPEEKATTFNTFNCVICMDWPTDLTATACGMSFFSLHEHAVC
jgi:hypothetical protein